MSQGLKIGLIVAGAGVVGLFILRNASASALPAGATSTTAAAPTGFAGLLSKLGIGSNTAPPPGSVATTPATTALAPAPGAPTSSGLSKVASGIWSVDKSVISGTLSGAKTVVSGAVGVASGALHSILSVF